jgi:UDP-N-acetyl-D-galactosamine dehydrogenase
MKSDIKINEHKSLRVGILGLGYIGLPLAAAFSKTRPVFGFDVSETRVKELTEGIDSTGQFSNKELGELENLKVSCNSEDLSELNCFIVTVPTPVDENNVPDLDPLKSVTSLIAKYLKKGDLVIYESTVFPGATEEVCVPILEKVSDLEYNADFFCGYSPERLSPGDHGNDISKIVKVTSGSTDQIGRA